MGRGQFQSSNKQFLCVGGCGTPVYTEGEKCASCLRKADTINFLIDKKTGEIKDWESCPIYHDTGQPCDRKCSNCMKAHDIKQTQGQESSSIVGV